MRPETEALCAAVAAAERACFKAWCKLADRLDTTAPDVLVASQAPVHEAAGSIRGWCLADPAAAEAERFELMRAQVEGEQATEAAMRARRDAAGRDAIRQAWNEERCRIFTWRDAVTIGLGWPHRGEWVTIDGSYAWDGEDIPVTGRAVYLNSYDTHNTSCQVWVPGLKDTSQNLVSVARKSPKAARAVETLLMQWEPHEHWGNADPAGDIPMRLLTDPDRPLPPPLPRWPKPSDAGITPPPSYVQTAMF